VHADKWIPVIPNTDTALLLAVAHHWITEGNYEKEYVATHCFGFDKFCDYVLARKTDTQDPGMGFPITGIPEWTIHALPTSGALNNLYRARGGGMIRGPYSSEPARMEILCMAMQGIGMPGRHEVWPTDGIPMPLVSPDCSSAAPFRRLPWMKQLISKVFIQRQFLIRRFPLGQEPFLPPR
jgi:trimethylamine-N-oxide reductase (cytochrome c)